MPPLPLPHARPRAGWLTALSMIFALGVLAAPGLAQPAHHGSSAAASTHRQHRSDRTASGRLQTAIVGGHETRTTGRSARFAFRGLHTSRRFECRLDGRRWSRCTSPMDYRGLRPGSHRFEVRAVAARAVDRSPARFSWRVKRPKKGTGTTTPAPAPVTTTTTPAPTTTTTTPTTTTTTTTTDPAPAPAPTAKSTWRPVGSPILSDAEAAAHVRLSDWEPRAGNTVPNHTVPTQAQRDFYNAQSQNYQTRGLFTGNYTGTTDEIIQWVSWKWGLDEDVVRAVAATESWWNQNAYGFDYQGGGLMSPTWSQNPGLNPIGMTSTAANLEVFAGYMREYYDNPDGRSNWFNDVDHGQTYSAGDEWGSIGAWYAGRWHTAAAEAYITKVKGYLADRVWEQQGF